MLDSITKFILLLLFASDLALASPSHLSIVIGSALVCRDRVSAEYFNDYMRTYFGKPAFTAGEANWWKVDEKIFNAEVKYIFVGTDQDFIGATYKDDPDKLIAKVGIYTGIAYKLIETGKWVTPSNGVIIRYFDQSTPSKMYCIGAPHTAY